MFIATNLTSSILICSALVEIFLWCVKEDLNQILHFLTLSLLAHNFLQGSKAFQFPTLVSNFRELIPIEKEYSLK